MAAESLSAGDGTDDMGGEVSLEVGAARAGGERAAPARGGVALPRGSAPAAAFEARGPFLFRGGAKFYAKGVTYGPFRPNAAGEPFKEPAATRADFALMRGLGVD